MDTKSLQLRSRGAWWREGEWKKAEESAEEIKRGRAIRFGERLTSCTMPFSFVTSRATEADRKKKNREKKK